MVIPLLIIGIALLSAAIVTYGCSPWWGQFSHGVAFIVFSSRFQGLLIALSLIACIGLIMLIISGRQRAWWLIGLCPVLTLFMHRFGANRAHEWGVAVENPAFVSATDSNTQPNDYVVGMQVGDMWYAYPYAQLFRAPVIVHAGRSQRIVLMWSAYANRAIAMHASLEVRGADIDIVSTPANATLIYNGRTGQFINALTGETTSGKSPSGFGTMVPTAKMPWKDWLAAHPQTMVMDLHWAKTGPTQPMEPTCPMPAWANEIPDQRVEMVGDTRPMAIDADDISYAPINTMADGQPVMVFRTSTTAAARAMVRRVGDLRPQFHLRNTGHAPVRHARSAHAARQTIGTFVDADTDSTWSADGVWVSGAGEFKGTKLHSIPIDDDLSWRVMKFWYPDLVLLKIPRPTPTALAASE